MASIIEAKNIGHNFNRNVVLRGINLSVAQGESVGLVGENGTGKTTLLRILSTQLEPKNGSLVIDGIDALDYTVDARQKIGWMSDATKPIPRMTVREALLFYTSAQGLRGMARTSRVDELKEQVRLDDVWNTKTDKLSKGWVQRLGLALMLVNDAPLLILDEPLAGVDPHARRKVLELLEYLRDTGKTIIASSHILSELSSLCKRFIFLQDGYIAFDGSAGDMKSSFRNESVFLIRCASNLDKLQRVLAAFPSIQVEPFGEETFKIIDTGTGAMEAEIVKSLVMADVAVTSFRAFEDSLEQSFRAFVESKEKMS